MKASLLAVLQLLFVTCIIAQKKPAPQVQGKIQPVTFSKNSSKINPDLLGLYNKYHPSESKSATQKSLPFTEATQKLMQVKGNQVLVDFTVQDNAAAVKEALQKKGVVITGAYGRVISGFVPISALHDIESVAGVRYVMPAYKPYMRPAVKDLSSSLLQSKQDNKLPPFIKGPVISQGDTAQLSYEARKQYKVDGKGVKVGILSDSYNNLHSALTGVLHGELPGRLNPYGYKKPVQVIKDLDSNGSDEGRGMAEIVHDVAPGSSLAFYSAFFGQADFAQGIQTLADKGCQVICDDIYYFAEPFFQDGIIAQSVDKVKQRGVTYLSSAGNQGNYSYESDYRPSDFVPFDSSFGTAHNFSAPGDAPRYYQPIFIPSGYSAIFSFQWDQSFFSASGVGASSDYDIYLTDIYGNIVAAGNSDNIGSGDPVEVFGYYNNTSDYTFFITIVKYAGPDAQHLKYIMLGASDFYLTNPPIPGIYAPSLYGHNKAQGAISTGAAFYGYTPPYGFDTAQVEYYSSLGGTPMYFDTLGNRISTCLRKKPDVVAPDGANTSFFPGYEGADISYDADSYPNFFGTSAAAPHTAGVAALMIEAAKSHPLTPDQVKDFLSSTAGDMDNIYTDGFDAGYDFNTGYGFINAVKAVGKAASLCDDDKNNPVAASLPVKTDKITASSVTIYPNPFAKSFRVSLSLEDNEPVQVDLFNANGKKLMSRMVYQSKGTIDIDAEKYSAGLYLLQVRQGEVLTTIKVMKQ